jgi:hypothetical protein
MTPFPPTVLTQESLIQLTSGLRGEVIQPGEAD